MKCYDCDTMFEAETADELLMGDMYKHYMSEHKDIIEGGNKEEQAAWVAKFRADWEAAEEI